MRQSSKSFLASLAVAMVVGQPALAQSQWEFNVTPYAWMSGLSGDLGTVPGLPSQPVDLSFGDILDDLDYGLFLFASARNGPWVVFLDTSAVQTTSSESGDGPVVTNIEVESKTTTLAMAVGRTIASAPGQNLDAYLGFRSWWLDNEFKVDTTLGNVKRSSDAQWTDPLVGLAGRYTINDLWMLFGNAEVGGFGVGADLEWTLMAGAEYAFTDTISMSFGWRHQVVDYEDDGIVFDATQSGPLLGATFRF